MTIAIAAHPNDRRPIQLHAAGLVGFLIRLRYQLLGAFLVGVLLPAVVRTGLHIDWQLGGSSMQNTVAGTVIALILGFFIMHRMAAYPGVWALSIVLPSFIFSFLLTIIVFFFVRFDYSRFQFVVSFGMVVAWFYFVLILERRYRRTRLFLLPFGDGARLSENAAVDWTIAAIPMQLSLPFEDVSPRPTEAHWANSPTELPAGVSGVVADLRADIPASWEVFLAECALAGIPVYHSKQIQESLTGRVEMEHLSENTLGSLIPSSTFFAFKHALDLAITVIAAPVLLLIGLAAAVAIKLDDGGPIFFRQERMGYRGKVFSILKFRTMSQDAGAGKAFTLKNDQRITRVGAFLRRYRIDELPQAINILRGEMSWIGPRPESLSLSRWYETKIPFYSYRHIVRPGISGWAQVNQGNVAEIAAASEKLQYDFFYIKNFSPWLDLLISARTLLIVLTGFGSR